jgi:hypothetical protein
MINTEEGSVQAHDESFAVSPQIPIDLFYLVRIDSKERKSHIEILNRMWEEFNPPRTGIPVVIRHINSEDQKLSQDVTTGGSSIIYVEDNTTFNLNDPVFIFNDLLPTQAKNETFIRPFESIVVGKVSNNGLQLQDQVPDTFTVATNSRVVSNAEVNILMFHFVDHTTRDIEGAQYWSHEFTFWVQIWVDRLEEPTIQSDIHDIATNVEILD